MRQPLLAGIDDADTTKQFKSSRGRFSFELPRWYGWVIAFGGACIHLCLGSIYSWGNSTTYITSHLRLFDETITTDDTLIVYCSFLLCQAFMMYFGGLLEKRVGPRWCALLGGSLYVSGIFLASTARTLTQMAFFFGVMPGIGSAMVYTVPLMVGLRWLPHRKGLIYGIITAAFGGSAALFNTIITNFVNPNNLSPTVQYHNDEYFDPHGEVANRVDAMLIRVGTIMAALFTVGSLLMQNPPAHYTAAATLSSMSAPATEEQKQPEQPQQQPIDKSTLEVVKSSQGWIMWCFFLLSAASGLFVLGTYKSFGNSSPALKNDRFLANAGGVLSIANFLGRPVLGALADKFSFKRVLQVSSIIQGVLTCTIVLCVKVPADVQRPIFLMWACGIVFCYGGLFSVMPAATVAMFGKASAGANYGFVFTAVGLAGAVASMAKKPLSHALGANGVFYVMGALGLCAHCLTYLLRPPSPGKA